MNNWNAAYQPFIYEMILFFAKKYDKIEKKCYPHAESCLVG